MRNVPTMKKSLRLLLPLGLLLALQLACGISLPVNPTATAALTPTPQPSPTATPVPGPSGQLAYGSSTFANDSEIVLMDLETGETTRLTEPFEGEYYRPVWSPDGSKLAMREEISMDGGGIAVMDVGLVDGRPAGSRPVEISHGFADGPTWTPDGSRVAFVSTRETSGWTAYVADLVGSLPERLPGIPQHSTDLAWAPDGSWIAFTGYEDSSRQIKDIYVIRPDGSGLTNLTNTPDADEYGAAWSPDSRRIAYAGRERGESAGQTDIFTMNADGSGVVRVTGDPADEFDPAWSPDGTQIAFTSDRHEANDGNYEIYIIDADGTDELRVTNSPTTDRWPSWRTTPAGTSPSDCRPGASLVADVTVPDGTQFPAPREFTKVWRVRNSGSCAWAPAGFALRFTEGELLGGPAQIPLSGAVYPGATVDLSLALAAPAEPGIHTGTWVLIDAAGRPVPGPDGGPLNLSVRIEVMDPSASVLPSPLYFLSDAEGTNQIWRMESDGTTVAQITHETAAVDSYDVSPADGTIAFVSSRQLFLMRPDGADRRLVADFGEGRWGAPRFSPDGSLLAYAAEGIRLYEPATGSDRLLRANGSGESVAGVAVLSPRAWSPDGRNLLVSIGYYEGAELGILSVADGEVTARAPLADMYAWKNDGSGVLLASAWYPELAGGDPGLWLAVPGQDVAPLIPDAFVWWPFQRPDGQLAYFISRPAGRSITAYRAQMAASAADGSGEHLLRNAVLELDIRDSFTALWAADGSAALVRIFRPVSGAREILLLPAGDGPAVFLGTDGMNFRWGM
jgi:Tol biopolymer transport system component